MVGHEEVCILRSVITIRQQDGLSMYEDFAALWLFGHQDIDPSSVQKQQYQNICCVPRPLYDYQYPSFLR